MDAVQLRPERFDVLYYSPLARASQTATIVWGDRQGRIKELPSLREIDLYDFQVGSIHSCSLQPGQPKGISA